MAGNNGLIRVSTSNSYIKYQKWSQANQFLLNADKHTTVYTH